MGSENSCGASGVHGPRFYRFQDAGGRVHLVDSLDSVPQALRGHAVCIEYRESDSPTELPGALVRGAPSGYQLFGLGFAAALVVVFVFSRLPGTLRLVVRCAIAGGLVALFAGAYFGWLRRTAGQSQDALAGPGALIHDAKQAVDQMNARMGAQQAQLKEIEQAK